MCNIKVKMSQMHKWKVDSDNIRFYDAIMKNNGDILTLDKRGYVEYLCEFGIFFTANM